MQDVHLIGITWDHTRGYLPMVATAQRFGELHPEVTIEWRKRSLKAFGDQPLEELAPHFDLLVIDHPFVGFAEAHGLLLPLDELLSPAFLADQAAHSVGASYASYEYGGHLWALPIDAATPVSAWRADLLALAGHAPPETWDELLALARLGLVAVPAVKIDSLMHWYMLCIALGEEPFGGVERVVAAGIGTGALDLLRELLALCDPACLTRNPIRTYEALVAGAAAYCPFGYGYSNYARAGYAAEMLCFGELVRYNGTRLRSTLGGTGLAISAACQHPALAARYAQLVASPACQRGMYVHSGGQPGHRTAWEDPGVNAVCGDFFRNTLQTLDEAFLRPRYAGYDHFQDTAAELVHAYLADGGNARHVVEQIDAAYRDSRRVSREG
jgi:multiple sugar transport system substrate-binding protein